MTKVTFTWFQCALCPAESDTYYILTRDGKEIKVCKTCYENTKEVENNENNYTNNQR